MKKIFAIALILVLALSLLTACGDDGGSNNTPSGGTTSSNNDPNTPARVIDVPDQPLDLTDDSIYFVIIDGVKYNLYDVTVGDFLKAGFTMKYDENKKVDALMVFTDEADNTTNVVLYKGNHSFSVNPINYTNNMISLKDCNMKGITFSSFPDPQFDISTVCNLSVDCTKEDVQSVFGDSSNLTYESGRHHVEGKGDFGNKFTFRLRKDTVNEVNIALYKYPGS